MEKDCVTYCLKFAFLKVQLCIEKCYSNNKSFANMNSHHESIKLTVETNPTRFLGTAFNVNRDGSMTTKVFRKPGKFIAFWKSQIPKRYNRNN